MCINNTLLHASGARNKRLKVGTSEMTLEATEQNLHGDIYFASCNILHGFICY